MSVEWCLNTRSDFDYRELEERWSGKWDFMILSVNLDRMAALDMGLWLSNSLHKDGVFSNRIHIITVRG